MKKTKIVLFRGDKKILELPKLEDLKRKEISWPLDISVLLEDKGIYFLFDKEMNLLYIGKTNSLRRRLNDHLSPNYTYRGTEKSSSNIPLNNIKYLSFLSVKKEELRNKAEHIYLIIYKTKFNRIY